MNNYSYIFTFDRDPHALVDKTKILGIGQCANHIPLAFIILASQQAHLAKSFIWSYPEPMAIVANLALGKKRFLAFLHQLEQENLLLTEQAQAQVAQAKSFLSGDNRTEKHIVLECGQIFGLEQASERAENAQFFGQEIMSIELIIERLIQRWLKYKNELKELEIQLQQSKEISLFKKLFSFKLPKGQKVILFEIQEIKNAFMRELALSDIEWTQVMKVVEK